MSDLTPFGFNISREQTGMICLNDIWKAADSPKNKSVTDWMRLDSSKNFIETAIRFLDMGKSHIIKVQRGKGKVQGTFAHQQIALEYAQYLDPKLAIYVNELFLNPEVATNHAVAIWEKKGKSKSWIGERMAGILNRKQFTDALMMHGVRGSGFKDCTNGIYTPLWGGGADVVRLKKGLKEKSNTRESMSEIELAAVRLSELLAKESIEKLNAHGNDQCRNICEKSSKCIASGIIAMRNNNQKNLPSF